MDKEDVAKQVGEALLKFDSRMHFALGQIQALEVAFGTCLGALQSQPALLAQIRKNLEDWQQLNLRNSISLPLRDGFESTRRALEARMGEDQPLSVHVAPPGKLN